VRETTNDKTRLRTIWTARRVKNDIAIALY
jgi:hypothetical protein